MRNAWIIDPNNKQTGIAKMILDIEGKETTAIELSKSFVYEYGIQALEVWTDILSAFGVLDQLTTDEKITIYNQMKWRLERLRSEMKVDETVMV